MILCRRLLNHAVIVFLLFLGLPPLTIALQQSASSSSIQRWTQQLQTGYQRRVAADPAFASKSITEVLVAAGTQLTAEWNRRGADRLLPELDFVVPAILTAVFGKYYRYAAQNRILFLPPRVLSNFWFVLFVAYTKPIPLEQQAWPGSCG